MGTHLFWADPSCPCPGSAFSESSPSWQSDPGPKKGKPPLPLPPSPLPSKFGVEIVYYHFHGASEIQALSSSHFFFFPLGHLFGYLWNIPMYQLETGFGYQNLLLYPRSLMPSNATKPSLMVVSSALWLLWMVPCVSISRVGCSKMFLQKEQRGLVIEHTAGHPEAQIPILDLCNRLWAHHFTFQSLFPG